MRMKFRWILMDILFPCEFGDDCAYPYRTWCPHKKKFAGQLNWG